MVGGFVPRLQALVLRSYAWPDPVRGFLSHAAGPFTIHFWCPLVKWGIVFANLADINIPAENISTNQQIVLMCSGLIWTRFCTQVKPFNPSLMAVNFFMSCTAMYQIFRKITYKPVQVKTPK